MSAAADNLFLEEQTTILKSLNFKCFSDFSNTIPTLRRPWRDKKAEKVYF